MKLQTWGKLQVHSKEMLKRRGAEEEEMLKERRWRRDAEGETLKKERCWRRDAEEGETLKKERRWRRGDAEEGETLKKETLQLYLWSATSVSLYSKFWPLPHLHFNLSDIEFRCLQIIHSETNSETDYEGRDRAYRMVISRWANSLWDVLVWTNFSKAFILSFY